jgi:hypothetical protein
MINLWHKFIDWKRDYFDVYEIAEKKMGDANDEGMID